MVRSDWLLNDLLQLSASTSGSISVPACRASQRDIRPQQLASTISFSNEPVTEEIFEDCPCVFLWSSPIISKRHTSSQPSAPMLHIGPYAVLRPIQLSTCHRVLDPIALQPVQASSAHPVAYHLEHGNTIMTVLEKAIRVVLLVFHSRGRCRPFSVGRALHCRMFALD
jgi:hypothetical protein